MIRPRLLEDMTGAGGNEIMIWSIRGTIKTCEPLELMEQEGTYYQALGQTKTYQIKDDGLELRDETGALLVSYRSDQY